MLINRGERYGRRQTETGDKEASGTLRKKAKADLSKELKLNEVGTYWTIVPAKYPPLGGNSVVRICKRHIYIYIYMYFPYNWALFVLYIVELKAGCIEFCKCDLVFLKNSPLFFE